MVLYNLIILKNREGENSGQFDANTRMGITYRHWDFSFVYSWHDLYINQSAKSKE